MIVGNGDIARVLVDRPDHLYFASGVSNSGKLPEPEYRREVDLLMSQPRWQRLVYFSSLSVFYSTSRYARHKLWMERLVKSQFPRYTIVRLGNITWGTNPHTLINFLRGQIQRGEKLVIQDAYRYLVDQDEFLDWMGMIPDFNCELNVPGKRLKVAQIVQQLMKKDLWALT